MQNFCTNCGNKLNEADKFCSSCGKESNHNNYDITCVNCGYGLAEAKVLCPNCNKSPYEIEKVNYQNTKNNPQVKSFFSKKDILGLITGVIIGLSLIGPFGIIIGFFLGKYLGKSLSKSKQKKALIASLTLTISWYSLIYIGVIPSPTNSETSCFTGKNYQYFSINPLSREAIKFSSDGTVNYSVKGDNLLYSRFGDWKRNGNNIKITWKKNSGLPFGYYPPNTQTIYNPDCKGMKINGNYFVMTD